MFASLKRLYDSRLAHFHLKDAEAAHCDDVLKRVVLRWSKGGRKTVVTTYQSVLAWAELLLGQKGGRTRIQGCRGRGTEDIP